jgi:RNA polymerase sigma-70 factor (ECF subfamily)
MSPAAAEPANTAAIFWSESGERPADPATAEAVASDLAAGLAAARAAFPQLVLDEAVFIRHLARTMRAAAIPPGAVGALVAMDLYLACACLARLPEAASTLQARHGASIRAAMSKLLPRSEVAEAEQRLMASLLVGNASSPAKLQSYAGKAPLDRWLAVAAQNAALMWLRENRAQRRMQAAAAAEPPARGSTDPEIGFLKEKYRGEFERALADALARLPSRERVILRLHLVNGVTVEKIGKMLSVSQSTASRLLAAARQVLLQDIQQSLRERLNLPSDELASIAGMVASQIDLSLSNLLASK